MCSLLCQRPLTLHFTCTDSIRRNFIGVEGGKAAGGKAAAANTEIVMINVDQCPNMASETKVAAMPTFQFWKVQGNGDLAFEDDLTVVGANLAKCEQALN